MKKVALQLILICLIAFAGYSQEVVLKEDGLYYTREGILYTGKQLEYHPNGNIKTELHINNGRINGNVYIFFEDGTKNEVRAYAHGVMHGQWITWDETGQKIAEANYLDGLKNGKWNVWDENGTLLYDMTYDMGKRSGTWRMFGEDGTLVSEKAFD